MRVNKTFKNVLILSIVVLYIAAFVTVINLVLPENLENRTLGNAIIICVCFTFLPSVIVTSSLYLILWLDIVIKVPVKQVNLWLTKNNKPLKM